MLMVSVLMLLCLFGAMPSQGQGAIDVYSFDTPEQEQRYRGLTAEFRCPKCLNTNLAGSDAPIAADLRREVHDLLLQGKSDQQIRDYLQHRYGDFVLYDPPLRPTTWLLWFGPFLLLLGGGWLILRISRGGNQAVEKDLLSEQERARLEALTGSSNQTHD